MPEFENANPILEPENFFEGYQKSIEKLRNTPEVVEFDKLCYELFHMNEIGKRFMELVKERYLLPAMAKPGTATYQIDVIWADGFKDFGRLILGAVNAHNQRIKAGR